MQVLEINKMAANYFYYQLRTESGAQAMQYLKSRQLDDETIKRFALGYSSKYSSNLYQYFKSKKISDELLKESGLFNVDEKMACTINSGIVSSFRFWMSTTV